MGSRTGDEKPGEVGYISWRNGRGGGTGREHVSGNTCRELLKTAAHVKLELPQVFQVSDTFGEWNYRQSGSKVL